MTAAPHLIEMLSSREMRGEINKQNWTKSKRDEENVKDISRQMGKNNNITKAFHAINAYSALFLFTLMKYYSRICK